MRRTVSFQICVLIENKLCPGLDYRLDYILRESNLGVSYLSALTSHTAYWTNYDIAYFILTQIFPELEMGGSAAAVDPMDRPPQMQQDYIDYHEPSFPQQNPQFTLSQPYPGPSQPSQPMPMNQPYQPQYPQKPQQYQPQYQQQQQQFPQQMVRNPNPQQQPMQQKVGFFDRASGAMDLKQQPQQNVASPTKGTKSFFPSFNLSSLTSPVKNLSNSLSNISNQMTNIASQGNQHQPPHPQHQQHPQQRTGFLGGLNQQKPFSNPPQQQQYSQQQMMPQQQQIPHNYEQFGSMQQQQQYQPVQQQMNYQQEQHNFAPQQMPHMRSVSPYNHQPRSASPQAMQRAGMLQFGPLETPTGAVKQKITRIQPKVPTGFGNDMPGMNTIPGAGRGRCVSPLGQSKVSPPTPQISYITEIKFPNVR